MYLFITRHGQSKGNLGVHLGPDPELTEKGFRQAEILGERLSTISLDCIISSPLVRALATANEVAKRQPGGPTKVELLPELMEKGTDPGYAGLKVNELLYICPTLIPSTDPTPLGGKLYLPSEDEYETLSRANRLFEYLQKRFSEGDKVLLVGHGSFNTRLISAALGSIFPSMVRFSQDNANLTLISYLSEGGIKRPKLNFMNDSSHMLDEQLFERIC